MIFLFWLYPSHFNLDFEGLRNKIDLLNSFSLSMSSYLARHKLVSQKCHGQLQYCTGYLNKFKPPDMLAWLAEILLFLPYFVHFKSGFGCQKQKWITSLIQSNQLSNQTPVSLPEMLLLAIGHISTVSSRISKVGPLN